MRISLGYKQFDTIPKMYETLYLPDGAAMDALATTGWDLLIAKSTASTSAWVWRDSSDSFATYVNSASTSARVAFTNYATLFGALPCMLIRMKKSAGFLDIIPYTGNGSTRNVAHALGAVPAFIIAKRDSSTSNWPFYHTNMGGSGRYSVFPTVPAVAIDTTIFTNTLPTTTAIQIGSNNIINQATVLYRMYAFGPSDVNGDIYHGQYSGSGSTSGAVVSLPWEAEALWIKNRQSSQNMVIISRTRNPTNPAVLYQSLNAATSETSYSGGIDMYPDRFEIKDTSGQLNTNANIYLYTAFRKR